MNMLELHTNKTFYKAGVEKNSPQCLKQDDDSKGLYIMQIDVAK